MNHLGSTLSNHNQSYFSKLPPPSSSSPDKLEANTKQHITSSGSISEGSLKDKISF